MLEILIPIGIGFTIAYVISKLSPEIIMVILYILLGCIGILLLYVLGIFVQMLMGSPFPC